MKASVEICEGVSSGGGSPLFLIAGPCVLQSEELALEIGGRILDICRANGIPYIFKASFDKANRTSGESPRGPGLKEGLRMLRAVKESLGVPILTDIHEPSQVLRVAEVADILQVPAFLCRQTDLLAAAGGSGRSVNIKKGQFMAPEDMRYAVEKVKMARDVPVMLTERGSMFGYRDLVVDLRSLSIMRRYAPVIFDGAHSVQSPGGAGGKSGGQSEWIPTLVRGAVAAGVDGIFLEVHTNPEESPSDSANMITPQLLEKLLPLWLKLDRVVKEGSETI